MMNYFDKVHEINMARDATMHTLSQFNNDASLVFEGIINGKFVEWMRYDADGRNIWSWYVDGKLVGTTKYDLYKELNI